MHACASRVNECGSNRTATGTMYHTFHNTAKLIIALGCETRSRDVIRQRSTGAPLQQASFNTWRHGNCPNVNSGNIHLIHALSEKWFLLIFLGEIVRARFSCHFEGQKGVLDVGEEFGKMSVNPILYRVPHSPTMLTRSQKVYEICTICTLHLRDYEMERIQSNGRLVESNAWVSAVLLRVL